MSEENTMNLELLPNEIFLDLFDYFDGTDLLRAFYGLNTRFNFLLYHQFQSYHFRFGSVSKRRFDLICQQHLPFIADQVITIQLSDRRETSAQTNLFFSYIPSLRQFTHLRSLILSDFHSYDVLLKLLDQCQHLSYFTQLTFYSLSFSNASVDSQLIINKIWSLPKLTNYSFYGDIGEQQTFCIPTIISTSLECVTILYHKFQWSQLTRLLEYTPGLKRLSTWIRDSISDDYTAHSYPALVRLKICFIFSIDISKIIVFFQSMPNLRHLDVRTWSQLINGHQWKQIICNHLLQLKTFQLKMEKRIWSNRNIQQEAYNLLDSFRSSFWIDEHQWFVRCITWDRRINLETLSNASHYLKDTIPNSWQSTCIHDNQQEFYNTTTGIWDKKFFDQSISSNIRLPNVKYLDIKLPINEQFWSIVPNLDKLESLTVSSDADTFQSQLQTLLDRAHRLQTLYISQHVSFPLQMSVFNHASASIREIDLYECNYDFNEEECLSLTDSSFGVQCEVLSIRVTNRQSIIHLDKNMLNLRSLTVKCSDDKYSKRAGLTEHNDELVHWLKRHLSLLYMIVRDTRNNAEVLIWM